MKKILIFSQASMERSMSAFARKQHEIINSIVRFISVNMMDNFSWHKKSTNVFFHDKTMFKDIVVFWSKGMVKCFYEIISILKNFATFPVGAFFKRKPFFSSNASTRQRTIFHSVFPVSLNKYIFFTDNALRSYSFFFRRGFSFFTYPITLFRTIFSGSSFDSGWGNIKFFFTNKTIHKTPFVVSVIIALIVCCSQVQICYSASEWAKSEPLGTRNISDIDTYQATNNEALDRMLSNYRQGAAISYASAATITVGIGEVMCSSADGSVRKMRKNTSATTVAWASIDTGAEASSTTYYLYAVADADAATFTVIISANASTPQGGETYYARLGSFYNDGSGNILNDETITNDNNYYGLVLGDWVAKSANTNYLAATDGFACGYISQADGNDVSCLTDVNSTPTTVRNWNSSQGTGNDLSGCCTPVKRGDYYNVTGVDGTPSVYFLPLE